MFYFSLIPLKLHLLKRVMLQSKERSDHLTAEGWGDAPHSAKSTPRGDVGFHPGESRRAAVCPRPSEPLEVMPVMTCGQVLWDKGIRGPSSSGHRAGLGAAGPEPQPLLCP